MMCDIRIDKLEFLRSFKVSEEKPGKKALIVAKSMSSIILRITINKKEKKK